MPRVLIPLVDGFEEMEAIAPIDLLRRADITVVTAGIGEMKATGSHGITVETDAQWNTVDVASFDAIVLPGGPGWKRLSEASGLYEHLQSFAAAGKLVGAICAAPAILARAGLLKGKRAACFPGVEDELTSQGAELVREEVVFDGRIVTSRGAGTATPFALALIEALADTATAEKIGAAIVFRS